ncbi:MAG: hypothetical protein CL910_00600 [Deltaproteobacteria bacterium]|jgi:HEAT repeat protein|nr:hypothetical protein [Deltaproteobacteria bacterium]
MNQDIDPRDEKDPQSREEALAGLGDGRWAVRQRCVLWLHRAGDPEGVQALVPLTRDPKREVRQIATHAVGRRRAGEGFPDAVPLLMERALEDTSIRVRRFAVQSLAYEHAHPDLCGFFQQLLDSETDPKLHRMAGIGLWLSREAQR